MRKSPTRYSADGRWWWDGEQWQAVDTTPPPATDDDGTYPDLRAAPSGHRRLIVAAASAVVAILIILAVWLGATHLALPTSKATPTPTPSSAPTPRATPSAAATQAEVARYKKAVASGTGAVGGRVQTVDRTCAAPADLATCRSALVALGAADGGLQRSLVRPAPACLAADDARLRAAIGALDQAESTAVAGIDQGQPTTIERGLSSVNTDRQQLVAVSAEVEAATC